MCPQSNQALGGGSRSAFMQAALSFGSSASRFCTNFTAGSCDCGLEVVGSRSDVFTEVQRESCCVVAPCHEADLTSSSSYNYACMASYERFCFLWRVRLAPFQSESPLAQAVKGTSPSDGVAETFSWYSQSE